MLHNELACKEIGVPRAQMLQEMDVGLYSDLHIPIPLPSEISIDLPC
jgi:hypothetical protein